MTKNHWFKDKNVLPSSAWFCLDFRLGLWLITGWNCPSQILMASENAANLAIPGTALWLLKGGVNIESSNMDTHASNMPKRKIMPMPLRVLLYWVAVLILNDHERACRWTGQPYPL